MKNGDTVYLPVEFLEEDTADNSVRLKLVDDANNTHIFTQKKMH